jgi:hypothetical protein
LSHAFLAVLVCVWARGLFQGYTGLWFAPVLATEAFAAACPFGVASLLFLLWGRVGDPKSLLRRSAEAASIGALLLGGFAWGWIEPHAMMTQWLPGSVVSGWWCYLIGAVLGVMLSRLPIRSLRQAPMVLWALIAFFVVGPAIYDQFDHVAAGTRGWALLLLVASWLLATAALSKFVRRPAFFEIAAVVAVLSWSLLGPAPSRTSENRASVVLILVDTLRADSLELKDEDGRMLMPRVSELAERGLSFTEAIAPAPWTLPSTVSVLSGWNPHRHLFGREVDGVATPGRPEAFFAGALLRDHGYSIAGFVNNPYLRPYYGIGRYWLQFRRYHGRGSDGAALAQHWLELHRARPSVMLLHLMDPHWPYDAPSGWGRERRECADCESLLTAQYGAPDASAKDELVARYRAEVSYTDAVIGEFVAALDRRGVLDNSWVVVTSDHGEEFWEHGALLHGHSLYDEQLRVPLVIIPPRDHVWNGAFDRGGRVTSQVRLEDVGATILALGGAKPAPAGEVIDDPERSISDPAEASARLAALMLSPRVDGQSLLSYFGVARADGPQDLLPEERTPGVGSRLVLAGYLKAGADLRYALRYQGTKYISGHTEHPAELFDLNRDPSELGNLSADTGAALSEPPQLFDAALAASGLRPWQRRELSGLTTGALARDVEQQLRELGYLEEASPRPVGERP